VEKVIWITTASKKVLVAESDKPWQLLDWHEDIELLDGFSFNVDEWIKEKDIKLE